MHWNFSANVGNKSSSNHIQLFAGWCNLGHCGAYYNLQTLTELHSVAEYCIIMEAAILEKPESVVVVFLSKYETHFYCLLAILTLQVKMNQLFDAKPNLLADWIHLRLGVFNRNLPWTVRSIIN